jgi:hypothetical protein
MVYVRFEIDSSVGKLAEGSLLLQFRGLLGILWRAKLASA